ncbi:MAG: DUF5688 family protein [Clostridiales bacterium]|nr:DUF5688 family protein [Clostridiales bacterium]
MNFDEFTQALTVLVQERLPEHCEICLHPVPKNNGVLRTGMILKKDTGQISPTVYLEDYYKYFLNGYDLEELAEAITQLFLQDVIDIQDKLDPLRQTNFENVRSHIVCRLVNRSKNSLLIEDCPAISYLDLSILFYYLVDCCDTGISSIRITNTLASHWSVSTSELLSQALRNMPVYFPFRVEKMSRMIKKMLPESLAADDMIRSMEPHPMYVLTNKICINGATVLLYKDVLNELSVLLDSDLYLLPSSVHEIIAIPYENPQQQFHLEEMVQEINRTQVSPEEVLSDHVYVFRRNSQDVVYQNLSE